MKVGFCTNPTLVDQVHCCVEAPGCTTGKTAVPPTAAPQVRHFLDDLTRCCVPTCTNARLGAFISSTGSQVVDFSAHFHEFPSSHIWQHLPLSPAAFSQSRHLGGDAPTRTCWSHNYDAFKRRSCFLQLSFMMRSKIKEGCSLTEVCGPAGTAHVSSSELAKDPVLHTGPKEPGRNPRKWFRKSPSNWGTPVWRMVVMARDVAPARG